MSLQVIDPEGLGAILNEILSLRRPSLQVSVRFLHRDAPAGADTGGSLEIHAVKVRKIRYSTYDIPGCMWVACAYLARVDQAPSLYDEFCRGTSYNPTIYLNRPGNSHTPR